MEHLFSRLPCEERTYSEGSIIEAAGNPCSGICKIESGIVKVQLPITNKHVVIDLLWSGSIFGVNSLLDIENVLSINCLTEVKVVFIPKEIAKKQIRGNKIAVATVFLRSQHNLFRKRLMLEHDTLIEDRIIYFLFKIDRHYKSKWLKVKRQDIAEFANCSREHVSRLFLKFKKNKLIQRDGNLILVNTKQITQKYGDRIKMIEK